MLPSRQAIVRANKSADKCRRQQRWALGIHEAESHLFQKSACLFDRANGIAIQTPLLEAQLLEFLLSHRELRAASPELRAESGLIAWFSRLRTRRSGLDSLKRF